MPRFKAVYNDGELAEGEALDLARFVVELASRPKGPQDLVLVVDTARAGELVQLEAREEASEPAPRKRR